MRSLVLFFCMLWSCQGMLQAQRYRSISLDEQAEIAFATERWSSASTLYHLMIKGVQEYDSFMARALMANILAEDSVHLVRARELYEYNAQWQKQLLLDYRKLCVVTHRFDLYAETLEHLISLYPEEQKKLYREIIQFRLFLRQPELALQVCDQILHQFPQELHFLVLKARAFQMAGESSRALYVYQSILKLNSGHKQANLYVGNYYLVMGKAELQKLTDSVLTLNPVSSDYDLQMSYAQQRAHLWKIYFVHAQESLLRGAGDVPNPYLEGELQWLHSYQCGLLQSQEEQLKILLAKR